MRNKQRENLSLFISLTQTLLHCIVDTWLNRAILSAAYSQLMGTIHGQLKYNVSSNGNAL